jgi:hypothetical protein
VLALNGIGLPAHTAVSLLMILITCENDDVKKNIINKKSKVAFLI